MNKSEIEYLEMLSKVTQKINEVEPDYLDTGQLDRGLEDNENHPRYFGYKTGLNTDFENYLSDQIVSDKSHLSVLDVGSGRGAFLGDLEKIFGENISCFGISKINFENPLFTKNHYIIGDAFNEGEDYILDKIPDNSMNLVTSQFVDHPEDPRKLLNYLKNVSRILVPNGISRHLGNSWENNKLDNIKNFLEDSGIEMNYEFKFNICNNKYVGGTIIRLLKNH